MKLPRALKYDILALNWHWFACWESVQTIMYLCHQSRAYSVWFLNVYKFRLVEMVLSCFVNLFFFVLILLICLIFVFCFKLGCPPEHTGYGQLSSNSMKRDFYRGSQDSLTVKGKLHLFFPYFHLITLLISFFKLY